MQETMDIAGGVVEFGTEAVLRYREIPPLEFDNELPEQVLSQIIAKRLSDRFRVEAHTEYGYQQLVEKLGANMGASEIQKNFGGLRSDVALLPQGSPPEIVELKIMDERKSWADVVADKNKIERLAKVAKIRGYLGVLVCETGTAKLDERVRELERQLGLKARVGDAQRALDGKWEWCFCCFAVC